MGLPLSLNMLGGRVVRQVKRLSRATKPENEASGEVPNTPTLGVSPPRRPATSRRSAAVTCSQLPPSPSSIRDELSENATWVTHDGSAAWTWRPVRVSRTSREALALSELMMPADIFGLDRTATSRPDGDTATPDAPLLIPNRTTRRPAPPAQATACDPSVAATRLPSALSATSVIGPCPAC